MRLFATADKSKCLKLLSYGIAGCPLLKGFEYIILKSMEIQFGHSELSVISQVSAVEGCPLSGFPLIGGCRPGHTRAKPG